MNISNIWIADTYIAKESFVGILEDKLDGDLEKIGEGAAEVEFTVDIGCLEGVTEGLIVGNSFNSNVNTRTWPVFF